MVMIVGFNMAVSLSHCVKSQMFSLFVSLSYDHCCILS